MSGKEKKVVLMKPWQCEAYFWSVDPRNTTPEGKAVVESKKCFLTFEFLLEADAPFNLAIDLLIEEANSVLSQFLKEEKIYRFMPFKNATFEYDDESKLSICYYHNVASLAVVTRDFDKGIVYYPNLEVAARQNLLYNSMYLNFLSEEIFGYVPEGIPSSWGKATDGPVPTQKNPNDKDKDGH